MKQLIFVIVVFLFQVVHAEVGMVADITASMGMSFKAKTNKITGMVIAKGDSVSAKDIKVDLKSVTTGLSLRDKHTKEKYLEVNKYPEAILTIGSGKGGVGTGKLKLKNIEKDISGTYKISGDNLKADFSIKLSDFGIKNISFKGVGVDDNVVIHVEVPVKK